MLESVCACGSPTAAARLQLGCMRAPGKRRSHAPKNKISGPVHYEHRLYMLHPPRASLAMIIPLFSAVLPHIAQTMSTGVPRPSSPTSNTHVRTESSSRRAFRAAEETTNKEIEGGSETAPADQQETEETKSVKHREREREAYAHTWTSVKRENAVHTRAGVILPQCDRTHVCVWRGGSRSRKVGEGENRKRGGGRLTVGCNHSQHTAINNNKTRGEGNG